jgi:hypothetical protein
MNETTLVREKLHVVEIVDSDSFFEKCRDDLGYRAAIRQVEESKARAIVAKVFDSLAFAPLKNDAVEAYKNKMAWGFLDYAGIAVVAAVALSVVTAIILGILANFGLATKESAVAVLLGGIFGPILMGFAGLVVLADTVGLKRWRDVLLKEYRDTVPRFALHTAMEIKEALAEYDIKPTFYVSELRSGSDALDDPFLYMKIGDDIYYLEAWEESGFDVQRKI